MSPTKPVILFVALPMNDESSFLPKTCSVCRRSFKLVVVRGVEVSFIFFNCLVFNTTLIIFVDVDVENDGVMLLFSLNVQIDGAKIDNREENNGKKNRKTVPAGSEFVYKSTLFSLVQTNSNGMNKPACAH